MIIIVVHRDHKMLEQNKRIIFGQLYLYNEPMSGADTTSNAAAKFYNKYIIANV